MLACRRAMAISDQAFEAVLDGVQPDVIEDNAAIRERNISIVSMCAPSHRHSFLRGLT
jgi:hypothetical protein